jgi:potassium/chloride transporter 9
LTFITYGLVILAMASSITRESFYNNANVIQVVCIRSILVCH